MIVIYILAFFLTLALIAFAMLWLGTMGHISPVNYFKTEREIRKRQEEMHSLGLDYLFSITDNGVEKKYYAEEHNNVTRIKKLDNECLTMDKMRVKVKIYRDEVVKKAPADIQPEHFVEGYIQAVKDIYNDCKVVVE